MRELLVVSDAIGEDAPTPDYDMVGRILNFFLWAGSHLDASIKVLVFIDGRRRERSYSW